MRKLISIAMTLFLSGQLMAQSELKTKSISIFKNGKSFVTKEGNVSTDKSVYTLREVPEALLIKTGSKWVSIQPSAIKSVEFSSLPQKIVKRNTKTENDL